MTISFFLPAIPRGQSRARHNRSGITYKTKDQKMDEQSLQAQMLPYRPDVSCPGAIKLKVTAIMPIPPSRPRKWQMLARNGTVHPTGKPDASNVLKNIEDVMQSMRFFNDDKQIVHAEITKRYGDEPGYHIEMEEIS